MQLNVSMPKGTRLQFMGSQPAYEWKDGKATTMQRLDADTGEPLWKVSVQALAGGSTRVEDLQILVASRTDPGKSIAPMTPIAGFVGLVGVMYATRESRGRMSNISLHASGISRKGVAGESD